MSLLEWRQTFEHCEVINKSKAEAPESVEVKSIHMTLIWLISLPFCLKLNIRHGWKYHFTDWSKTGYNRCQNTEVSWLFLHKFEKMLNSFIPAAKRTSSIVFSTWRIGPRSMMRPKLCSVWIVLQIRWALILTMMSHWSWAAFCAKTIHRSCSCSEHWWIWRINCKSSHCAFNWNCRIMSSRRLPIC